MRSFSILKKVLKLHWDYDGPPRNWHSTVQRKLKANNIGGQSFTCFSTFFRILPVVISKAFTVETIQSGWKCAGLFPLDLKQILTKCPVFSLKKVTNEMEAKLMVGITDLIQEAKITGMVDDGKMEAILSDYYEQTCIDKSSKPINHWRALWCNKETVLQKRKEVLEKREAERRKSEEKKQQAALNKQAREMAHDSRQYTLSAQDLTSRSMVQCATDPGKFRCVVESDDGWRGCPYCDNFYCLTTATCQKAFLAHRIKCYQSQESFDQYRRRFRSSTTAQTQSSSNPVAAPARPTATPTVATTSTSTAPKRKSSHQRPESSRKKARVDPG